MIKPTQIVAGIAVGIDTLLSLLIVAAVANLNFGIAMITLIMLLLFIVPMGLAVFNVHKNKNWAIALIVVASVSILMSISNQSGSIPLLAIVELVCGIILISEKE